MPLPADIGRDFSEAVVEASQQTAASEGVSDGLKLAAESGGCSVEVEVHDGPD